VLEEDDGPILQHGLKSCCFQPHLPSGQIRTPWRGDSGSSRTWPDCGRAYVGML
jgi:hypothetical protein